MFILPEPSPLSPDLKQPLESALGRLDPLQRAWLGGVLSVAASTAAATPAVATPLTVLYGTESGNSETLADRTVKEAKRRGFKAVMKNMADSTPAELAKITNLLVIVSTWGEGDPPESAETFYKTLMAETIDLSKAVFSVCALGDTSYERFCHTGKMVDERLEQLGGKRFADRQDCDVDYEEAFNSWLSKALGELQPAQVAPSAAAIAASAAPAAGSFGKSNPFPAETLDTVVLNGEGSAKETVHLEFSLEGSGLTYEAGDALAVIPTNAADVVQAVLDAAKLTGSEEIDTKHSGKKSLADALRHDFDITALSHNVLTKLADASGSEKLRALLADDAKEQLKQYTHGREIMDAIHDFAPNGLPAQELAGIFRKLPPRLYSIASSPHAHAGEVHLTVAAVRYDAHGRKRKGVCSTYLADAVKKGETVPVFIQPNKNFRLPADPGTPIIMVGPGTGIAPFRAFVAHRAATEAPGKNWLFFGDQHYLYDFLYQLEWQDHLKNGSLHRLDVAFSRDQPEKIYVQDKLREHGKDVHEWLEEGAHFYVCGDASRMAHDVHEALLSIVETHGKKSRENSEKFLEELKKSKRYQRDVY
ncbi:MAG: assimilatory sulfite reductase (NADPH) flavoprotein subunit [Verrucomicrobiota bacterium]